MPGGVTHAFIIVVYCIAVELNLKYSLKHSNGAVDFLK